MEAFTFGKPSRDAVSEKESTVSRRPFTERLSWPCREAKPWTPEKKSSMLKKLPSKMNENGIVGKPAEPTADPGGRPAAAVWDAGTPVAGGVVPAVPEELGALAELDELDELEASVDDPDAWPAAATCAIAGAGGAALAPVEFSFTERKSMCESRDAWSSW